MVTLSLTRSRVAAALLAAAADVRAWGWDLEWRPLIHAIDAACGFQRTDTPEEDLSIAAWDALAAHVGADVPDWEQTPGRTRAEVLAALEATAQEVAS
jgi:hypothetical protein